MYDVDYTTNKKETSFSCPAWLDHTPSIVERMTRSSPNNLSRKLFSHIIWPSLQHTRQKKQNSDRYFIEIIVRTFTSHFIVMIGFFQPLLFNNYILSSFHEFCLVSINCNCLPFHFLLYCHCTSFALTFRTAQDPVSLYRLVRNWTINDYFFAWLFTTIYCIWS